MTDKARNYIVYGKKENHVIPNVASMRNMQMLTILWYNLAKVS